MRRSAVDCPNAIRPLTNRTYGDGGRRKRQTGTLLNREHPGGLRNNAAIRDLVGIVGEIDGFIEMAFHANRAILHSKRRTQ